MIIGVSGKLFCMVEEVDKLLLAHDTTLYHVNCFVLEKFVMCHQAHAHTSLCLLLYGTYTISANTVF